MADIHIHRSHDLGLAKARKMAWKWAETVEEKFDMECTVIEGDDHDVVEFRRAGVDGRLRVEAGAFDLTARLGLLLGAFSGRIASETEAQLAAQKAAGVLGDDLALNAQQVSGVRADRERPVVWAVAKGSLINKVILVPTALAISALASWLVTPLLMVGGAFLCYEGFEKLAHRFLHSREEDE